MKPGDIVKLKSGPDVFYDWGEVPPSPVAGYYLRNSELTLLNGSLLARHRRVDFKNTDLCLVLGVKRNHLIVLTPRKEMGLIHVDKVEVAS